MIYDNYDFATEILVASVRNPIHILDAAKSGDVVTAPPGDLALVQAPLTDAGSPAFSELGGDRPEDRLTALSGGV